MPHQQWTKERIRQLLLRNDVAVERGIVALHRRQTQDEKADASTHHRNGQGFSANLAEQGSHYAKLIHKGKRLEGHDLQDARRICLWHARQLAEIAEELKT